MRSAIITTAIGFRHHEVFPSFLQVRVGAFGNVDISFEKDVFFLEVGGVDGEGEFHDPIGYSKGVFGELKFVLERFVGDGGWVRRGVLGSVRTRKLIMCF